MYLNDILVFSASLSEHIGHLHTLLQCLHKEQLCAPIKKYSFFQCFVEFLGHIFGTSGTQAGSFKLEAIFKWPAPIFIKQM